MAFYDTVQVFYQRDGKKGSAAVQLKIDKENRFYPFAGSLPFIPFTTGKPAVNHEPEAIQKMVQARRREIANENAKLLKEVKVQAIKKSKTELLNEQLASPLYNTANEQIFDFVNDPHALDGVADIFQWMEGRINGLRIIKIEDDGEFIYPHTQSTLNPGQRVPMMRDAFPHHGYLSLIHI